MEVINMLLESKKEQVFNCLVSSKSKNMPPRQVRHTDSTGGNMAIWHTYSFLFFSFFSGFLIRATCSIITLLIFTFCFLGFFTFFFFRFLWFLFFFFGWWSSYKEKEHKNPVRKIQLRGFSLRRCEIPYLLALSLDAVFLSPTLLPELDFSSLSFFNSFLEGSPFTYYFFSKANRLIQILVKDDLFWEKSWCYETYFLHRDLLSVQLCPVQVGDAPRHFCARGHCHYAVAFCPRASCICDHLCTKYL